jgi:hypothetical protein
MQLKFVLFCHPRPSDIYLRADRLELVYFRSLMTRLLLFSAFILFHTLLHAQVGINNSAADASSILDITSTSKGLLIPRLNNTQMNAISNPATGLMIYNTSASALYYYNGRNWVSREDRVTAKVDDGVAVQLDNLRAMMSTTNGQRSLMIATVSGTVSISGTGENRHLSGIPPAGGAAGTYGVWIRQSNTFGTSFAHFYASGHFPAHGAVQILKLMDETNGHAYEVVMMVGNGWKGNLISIKRIY